VTNGLRSGDLANTANNLDSINNNTTRQIQNPTVAPGILSLTGHFSDGQAQMLMRGLNQKKGIDVMARPSIVTRSGQAASVLMAREFIYPTEYDPPELPNQTNVGQGQPPPVTPANPTTFETRQVGVSLDVLPVADATKRYIDVTINPSITEFEGFVNFGSPITSTVQDTLGNTQQVKLTDNTILMPVFSAQKTATQLTVADGSTIVISGLMSNSIQKVEDKVPMLGDLPFVGRLFQSVVNKPVSTVIIFLVHVELLDPTGRPYRDR
jgi:general secretion pathway protein D